MDKNLTTRILALHDPEEHHAFHKTSFLPTAHE